MKELYELKDLLCKELKEYGSKGELTAGTLDVVDKLAHTVKNLDKIIETYEDGDSGYYPWAYDDGMSRNRGRSYNMSGRRDSMGRYSRDGRYANEGYSRHDLSDKLRELMDEAPDDRTRMEIKRLIDKM